MIELTPEQLAILNEKIIKSSKEEARKRVEELDKKLDIVVDKLSKKGWTLPAEIGIYAVEKLAQTNELDDVNLFLKSYFIEEDYFHAKNMIEKIKNSSIREGLKNLIEECWKAFRNDFYAVCGIALISAIEGILSEFSDNKNSVNMIKVCKKKVESFQEDESPIQKHVWLSYNNFIKNLYQYSDFTTGEPENINRHWLLHGRSEFEINELDCIRLFNAIESLCMIVNIENKA